MHGLTVAFVTSRRQSNLHWFLDSLKRQNGREGVKIIVVDSFTPEGEIHCEGDFLYTAPKPTIWQGPHRITREDWWAKSNALNTATCLCRTPWIAFVDDRCVLMPGWLDCIYDAMKSEYAVVGNYEKRANMVVVDGQISDPGVTLGADNRRFHDQPYRVNGGDFYGGHCALPLEWCLAVNGWPENLCDGLGSEDSMFGVTLADSGFPICYDPRMLIIEDRTPGEIDGALKRADKGVSPNDKSHSIVNAFRGKTSSQNSFDIRNMRDRALAGEPFPPPSASHIDWFDGQPISEME